MTRTFEVTKLIWRRVDDYYVHICPECESHVQNHIGLDCKNTFTHTDKNGVTHALGQCMCYSIQHGVRC